MRVWLPPIEGGDARIIYRDGGDVDAGFVFLVIKGAVGDGFAPVGGQHSPAHRNRAVYLCIISVINLIVAW